MKNFKIHEVLLLCFCLFTFANCSDNDESENDSPGNQPAENYISPIVPNGHIAVEALQSHRGPFLGAGYDIMGSFLSNTSIKDPVLDLNKIGDGRITYNKGSSGDGGRFVGSNIEEFLQSFTRFKEFKVPGENRDDFLFTNTITEQEKLDTPYDYSSQYSFAFEYSGGKMEIQRLMTLSPKWDSWLSDEFRQTLEQESPEALIERYGTHILVNAHLGYTVNTLYRSVVAADTGNQLLQTITAGLGARRSTIINNPNVTVTYPEETVKKNYGGTIAVSLQGGDYKSLPPIQLTPNEVIGDPMIISPWVSTSNEDTYALTNLSGDDLLPIYEVITDPIKKQQIMDAVIEHIKSHQLPSLKTSPIYQADDGSCHRYYTSFAKLSEKEDVCHGVIGSVFERQEEGTVPLYLSSTKEYDRLSLVPIEGGTIIGYVCEKWNNDLDCIYEITDGKSYAYTREQKEAYGEKGSWKPTGKYFYTKKI